MTVLTSVIKIFTPIRQRLPCICSTYLTCLGLLLALVRRMVTPVAYCFSSASEALQASGRNPRALHDGVQNLQPPTALPGNPRIRRAHSAMTPPGSLKQRCSTITLRPSRISTVHVGQDPASMSRAKTPSSFDRLDQLGTRSTGQGDRTVSSSRARPEVRSLASSPTPDAPLLTAGSRGSGALSPAKMPQALGCAGRGGSDRWLPECGDETAAALLRGASRWRCRCAPHPVTPADRAPYSALVDWRPGQFRLTDCFPGDPEGRPPWLATGRNRSLLFPLIVRLYQQYCPVARLAPGDMGSCVVLHAGRGSWPALKHPVGQLA